MQAVASTDGLGLKQALTEESNSYLQYRNYFWDEDYPQGNNYHGKDVKEWTQAVKLGYSSGYIGDVIGVDLASVSVFDVGHASEDPSADFRPAGNRANNGESERTNLQTLYLKSKLELSDDARLHLGYGKKFRHYSTYQGQGNRIALSASQGLDGNLKWNNQKFYFSVIDGIQRSNAVTHMDDLVNHNGEQIDFISLIGAKGVVGNIGYNVEFNKSDDYLERFFAKVNYSVDSINTKFEARYRQEQEAGSKFEYQDHESGFINLIAVTAFGDVKLTTAYQRVFDGDMYSLNSGNGYGTRTNSVMFEWEMPGLEGEDTALIKFKAPLNQWLWDGLKGEYTFMHSFGADHVTDFKRTENNFRVTQDFGALIPELSGLSLCWYQVWVRAGGIDDGYRANKYSEMGTLYSGDISRFQLTYKVSF